MRGGRTAAAVLAGGLALGHPCPAAAPAPAPSRSRPAPASQPASSPASAPALVDELAAYRLAHHHRHDVRILGAARRWGHDPFVFRGLLYTESRLEETAQNDETGATGIGQMTEGGRAALANLRRARGDRRGFSRALALDPREAIEGAAELLAYARDFCGGLWQALALYNTGRCAPRVTGFVRTVEKHANRFRQLAGLPPAPPLERARPARRVARAQVPRS